MKILDIPQSGKRGLNVSQGGRNGQISRILAIPSNPHTSSQSAARARLAAQSAAWKGLTDVQREAWRAAASLLMSRSRLGQNGPLTGLQLFVKVNVNLTTIGLDALDDPPAVPAFGDLAVTNLTIVNATNVITIRMSAPSSPGENTLLFGSKPVSAGVHRVPDLVMLGTCPPPQTGSCNITALYTAKYGVPAVGKRIFIQAHMMTDGFTSVPAVFNAVVPVSS